MEWLITRATMLKFLKIDRSKIMIIVVYLVLCTVTRIRIFSHSMSGHILKNQQKGDWNGVVVAVMDPIMTTYSIFNATMGIESLARACIYTKHLSNFKTSNWVCGHNFIMPLSIHSMLEIRSENIRDFQDSLSHCHCFLLRL